MKTPQRILVYRVGSLGDALVILPAFHLVRRAFPEARLTLLTSIPVSTKAAPMEAILRQTDLYHDTLSYPTSLRDVRALLGLARRLRAGRYDCLVYLARPKGGLLTSLRDYLFFRLCGIRRIIGVPFSHATLACRPVPGTDLFRSETQRALDCLRSLGTMDLESPEAWDLRLTSTEETEAAEALAQGGIEGSFLAISVGTKVPANDWEEPNWQELMRRLGREHPDLPLVAFGAAEERERTDRLLSLWPGPKANLCGRTSPRASAAALRGATLMICHDSGPMHLAATVGVPCVAIFSARGRPGEWYPRGNNHIVLYHQTPCWGCRLTVCVERGKACILSISVEEVFGSVQGQLARYGRSKPVPAPALP